jgi:hypothetical protein
VRPEGGSVSITFSGITSARSLLARLNDGLHKVAGGEVRARAVAKVAEQVSAVVAKVLAKHELSGEAESDTAVAFGTMVQVQGMPPRNAKTQQGRSYLSVWGWWMFRAGMPPFIVRNAGLIFAREVIAALRGQANAGLDGDLVLATEAAELVSADVKRRAAIALRPRMRRPRRG